MHLAQSRSHQWVCCYCFKKPKPLPPLSTKHTSLWSTPPLSLLVLLLLSEQPNEAEGQQSARAILSHYARIHSLPLKQPALKNKPAYYTSLHISAKCSRMQATPLEKKSGREKKKPPNCSACVRARLHMCPFVSRLSYKLYKHILTKMKQTLSHSRKESKNKGSSGEKGVHFSIFFRLWGWIFVGTVQLIYQSITYCANTNYFGRIFLFRVLKMKPLPVHRGFVVK